VRRVGAQWVERPALARPGCASLTRELAMKFGNGREDELFAALFLLE
jgi:hypothetical protein